MDANAVPGGNLQLDESGELTGSSVGRFRIGIRLGGGGMGEVYRAEDSILGRPVALKRVAPHLRHDARYRERLLREARQASSLSNPNVTAVYDVVVENDELFVVMELVEGQTLRQRLCESLSLEQFYDLALQSTSALAAAHQRGIVHRDIKPTNIMLNRSGQVKILDFGVAKLLPTEDETLTFSDDLATGNVLGEKSGKEEIPGTPAYMAPEALLGNEVDHRADIFSLGLVFYEALAGRHPFRGGILGSTASRLLHEKPPKLSDVNPDLPPELDGIVNKMLAKNPAERYATAADLLVDLRAARGATASLAKGRVLRRPWAAAVILTLALFLSAVPAVRDWAVSWWRPALPPSLYVAVLPFRIIGGGPEDQALSYGMADTLTAKLARLTPTRDLQVVPASGLRDRRWTAEDLVREFAVSLVLEGTMTLTEDRVRVNIALVDPAGHRQLRAETITASKSDPFALQDRVAEAAVAMLEIEVQPQELRSLGNYGTQMPAAYNFYLRGRGYLLEYAKPENIEYAIADFRRALAADPNYGLAHAGLGQAFWRRYEREKEATLIQVGQQHCEAALKLDRDLAEGHLCLGIILNARGEYTQAATELNHALRGEPSNDEAYRHLAMAYRGLQRTDEAEQTLRQAIRLRPMYWASHSWLGAFFYSEGRYQEAAEAFQQATKLAPSNARMWSNLGGIYLLQGRFAEAFQAFERSTSLEPSARAYSNLATAHYHLGRFAEAAANFEIAVNLEERNATLWGNLGDAYSALPGQQQLALSAYRTAISLGKEELRVNPKDADLLASLAHYSVMVEEHEEAMRFLNRALRLDPMSPDVLFEAAFVQVQRGNLNAALDWLEKAVQAGYSRPVIRGTPAFVPLQKDTRFQQLLGPISQ